MSADSSRLPSAASAYQIGALTSDAVLKLHKNQVSFMWRKVSKHIITKDHGMPLSPELHCQVLPPLEQLKEGLTYTREHSGVKNKRGPYLKADYSFSGAYAQTTLTQKANSTIDGGRHPFPTTRTFQVTHLSLLQANKRPPEEEWQIYNASHLCGNGSCIRPEHLIWERLDSNFSRRMCHVYGADEECPHNPECIHRATFGAFRSFGKK